MGNSFLAAVDLSSGNDIRPRLPQILDIQGNAGSASLQELVEAPAVEPIHISRVYPCRRFTLAWHPGPSRDYCAFISLSLSSM